MFPYSFLFFTHRRSNSDLTHLWEVVDVAKERLVNSTSTCSSPGGMSGGYGGQLSTGRKTQRVVKASSTAPVITHAERPRSAHNENDNSSKDKRSFRPGFLGIEDSFDKAISLPNSPVTKDQPPCMTDSKKETKETKKAQRRHHTHHLFDGILHTISGGGGDEIKVVSKEASETLPLDVDKKDNGGNVPTNLLRRWSETTSPNSKPPQDKSQKVFL